MTQPKSQINSMEYNYAILDIDKQYRFTMIDVDTNKVIIIDENTERKAFRKVSRFLGEKNVNNIELQITNKINNPLISK